VGDKSGRYITAEKPNTFICRNLEIWEPQTPGNLEVFPDIALLLLT